MNNVELRQYVSTAREKCVGEDTRLEAFYTPDLTDECHVCMSSLDGQFIRRYHKFVFRSCDLFSVNRSTI